MFKEKGKISRRNSVKNTAAALIAGGLTVGANSHGPELPQQGDESKPGEESAQGSLRRDNHSLIIDVHRHCLLQPSAAMEGLMRSIFKYWIGWEEHEDATTVTIDGITIIAYPELIDLDAQMKGQDESGVTLSLLSASMFMETLCKKMIFIPDMKLNKRLNDVSAGMVARYPDKLNFMVNVNPFNSASIEECERCFNELGAKGISLGTSWDGEFLDAPQLDRFWEYAEDKDEAIFLHPPLVPIGREKMNVYKLEEMVGRPFDTTMTVSRMIFSGVFDRYPKLKVVVPHMGGGIPNVIGRLDFGYRLGYKGFPKGQEAVCKRMPSEYLRTNLYADTMGFSAHGIQHCIDLFGADRVLFGSDYAAVPISPKEHVDIVRSLGLSPEDEEKILWKNANTLFRLL